MIVEIITPTESLFSGSAKGVKVPGTKGSFEMLHNHAPIISTLEKGMIVITDEEGKKTSFQINGGVIEQAENKIIILVE